MGTTESVEEKYYIIESLVDKSLYIVCRKKKASGDTKYYMANNPTRPYTVSDIAYFFKVLCEKTI